MNFLHTATADSHTSVSQEGLGSTGDGLSSPGHQVSRCISGLWIAIYLECTDGYVIHGTDCSGGDITLPPTPTTPKIAEDSGTRLVPIHAKSGTEQIHSDLSSGPQNIYLNPPQPPSKTILYMLITMTIQRQGLIAGH